MTKETNISIGILVFKEDKILFGRKKDKDNNIKYILPVGHLEFMESFSKCAKREIAEECGIEITEIKFHFLSNTDNYKPKHYIHIGLIAKWKSGTPMTLEPNEIETWEWRNQNDIPKPLSKGTLLTIKALKVLNRNYHNKWQHDHQNQNPHHFQNIDYFLHLL